MLQVEAILLQVSLDLQQISRSEPAGIQRGVPPEVVGHLGIVEMLQVDRVLQQNEVRMLQIQERGSP